MNLFLTGSSNLISWILFHVVKFVPRNKNKWVFGDRFKFVDNPKYLFIDVSENHKEIRSIWMARRKEDVKIVRSLHFEVYYRYSLKGLYHSLTAGVFIFDHSVSDINKFTFGGAFLVNLWHGSSVKKVRWQAKDYYVRKFHLKDENEMESFKFKILQYCHLFVKTDLLLAPSEIQANTFFSPMLRVPINDVVVGVFPRSKLMIKGEERAFDFISRYEPGSASSFIKQISQYKKRYIYMPTWRLNNIDFIQDAGINWEVLNDELHKKNELLILKFHPLTKIDFDGLSKFKNISIFPSECDIYTIYPFIDCLITDYSSVYTDFLIMNKEVIFFLFDYEDYMKNSYDLEEYDKYYRGIRAWNFTQLMDIIKGNIDCHVPNEEYTSLMNFFWDNNKKNIDLAEVIKDRIKI